MAKTINTGITAPDFELMDTNDQKIKLSDFREQKYVVLVFNRGFS